MHKMLFSDTTACQAICSAKWAEMVEVGKLNTQVKSASASLQVEAPLLLDFSLKYSTKFPPLRVT